MVNNNVIKILLIEDDPGDIDLFQEILAEADYGSFEITFADQLSSGLDKLINREFDVVLLDLSLPDSQGLDTLTQVFMKAFHTPIIVLTGQNDKDVAIKAMRKGAQDYLVKDMLTKEILIRSIRYAIERKRMQTEVEQVREQKRQEREFLSFEQISDVRKSVVSTSLYGALSLKIALPEEFQSFIDRYQMIIEQSLEKWTFKVEHNISDKLKVLAEHLGDLNCGPRDVVEIHSDALELIKKKNMSKKFNAYVEEARLLILELMGYLVSYYKKYSIRVPKRADE